MTLEIRKGIEKALNKAASSLKDGDGRPERTKAMLGALTDEGNHHGFFTCVTSGINQADAHEWLLDACWLLYDKGKQGAFRKMVLAAECEWGNTKPYDYESNFSKLMVVRADLRLLICEVQTREKVAELLKWLEQYASGLNAAKCDEYMISCWILDENQFVHEYFVAR